MAIASPPTFTKPARQRWEAIPADIRQRLLSNVWCGQCRHYVGACAHVESASPHLMLYDMESWHRAS